MNYNKIKKIITDAIENGSNNVVSNVVYYDIGMFDDLDPCGNIHEIMDNMPSTCKSFWDILDEIATDMNGWLLVDYRKSSMVFFCKEIDVVDKIKHQFGNKYTDKYFLRENNFVYFGFPNTVPNEEISLESVMNWLDSNRYYFKVFSSDHPRSDWNLEEKYLKIWTGHHDEITCI